jgi:hypothetical protein
MSAWDALGEELEEDPKPSVPSIPRSRPRAKPKRVLYTPEFNEVIQYCRAHLNDIECDQFAKHCDPKYGKRRGGGGWSGAAKCVLAVLRKMQKEGSR